MFCNCHLPCIRNEKLKIFLTIILFNNNKKEFTRVQQTHKNWSFTNMSNVVENKHKRIILFYFFLHNFIRLFEWLTSQCGDFNAGRKKKKTSKILTSGLEQFLILYINLFLIYIMANRANILVMKFSQNESNIVKTYFV